MLRHTDPGIQNILQFLHYFDNVEIIKYKTVEFYVYV